MLDPTYLRYIYDNLIKGSIHPENESELPDGLIGLYEEAFEEHLPVVQRQQILKRFALFALLKKEVRVSFVAEVLEESEEEILEFISSFASWFNSPESGKYQFYHERLKVYLFQKLSEKEIQTIHEKLITRLEQSIEQQKADEFEKYALEFLSEHLYFDAMLNGIGKKLIDLAYSQVNWQRQLKISKGYTWSKNGLKWVMNWVSKYDEDEVIECSLKMVDLYNLEQSAVFQIIDYLVSGQFKIALNRLESFNPETGFILTIFSLIELLEDEETLENNLNTIKKIQEYIELKFIDIERFNKILVPDLIKKVVDKLVKFDIKFNLLGEYINKEDIEWIEPVSVINNFVKEDSLELVYSLLISGKMEEASLKLDELIKRYSVSLHNIIYTSKSDLILLKKIIETIVYKPNKFELLAFLRGLRGGIYFYDISYIFFNDYNTLKNLLFEIISFDDTSLHNQVKVRKELCEYATKKSNYVLVEKLLELYNQGELDSEHYLDDYNSILLDLVGWKLDQNRDDDAYTYIKLLMEESWGSQLDEARVLNSLIYYRKKSFSKAYEIINKIDDDEYKLKAFYVLYFESKKQKNYSNQEDYIKESIALLERNIDEFDLFQIYKDNSIKCFINKWSEEFIEFTEKMMSISENDFHIRIALCDFYNKTSQKERMGLIVEEMIANFENFEVYEKWIVIKEVLCLNRNEDISFMSNQLIKLVNEEETFTSELSNIVSDLVSLGFLSIAVPLLKNVQITSKFIKLNHKQVCEFIPLLTQDVIKIKHLLQIHSLSSLFFQENYPQEKINRFNEVLNIQWAIDIKKELDQLSN
jgi:hypothetical protein